MDASDTKSLPENAYRPLKPGETYRPVVPASATQPEATWRSVLWGLFLCAIFTAASAYSGLKVGQVMEAAIPISILAIGLARVYRRRSSLLENVIITGVGGVSGSVVAGAIFTLPALYILKLDPHPWQTIFICLAGGCLGVLFLIPLRRYFVRDMHGELPYPEATAITEVLVTGEKGGSQAKLLLQATGISAVYDFFVTTFQVWKEMLDFQFVGVVHAIGEKARMVLRFDAIAFILGLGYVMGLRASTLLCRRRCSLEPGARAADLVLRPALRSGYGHLSGDGPDRADGRRRHLPELRPVHRRRGHRHRRHLRHHQVAQDRRRLLHDRREGLQARRARRRGAHRPRHGDHEDPRRGDRLGRRGRNLPRATSARPRSSPSSASA